MPISKAARALYPKDWKQIRARILERAGHACEWCGVMNHAIGWREEDGRFVAVDEDFLRAFGHTLKDVPCTIVTVDDTRTRIIRIVLTIAHVHNPDPADVRPENLAALCQRCHNRHDAPMRQANAARTRRDRDPQADLLEPRP